MTHTFNLNNGSIRLIVSHHGKVYRKNTGLTIDKVLWNQKAKSLSAKCKDARVLKDLKLIDLRMKEREFDGVKDENDILGAIAFALSGDDGGHGEKVVERYDRPRFWDFFKSWSRMDVPSKKDRDLAYRRLSSIMGTKEDWEQIDTAYHARLVNKLNEMGYSGNYQATLIAKLKTVLIEGEKLKYHTNKEYKHFSYKWTTADTIALTQEEVDKIWDAELDGVRARARDCFIVGVYTAARFSDYSKISSTNIQDGQITLQFKQRKTQGEVIIPLAPRVMTVLQRNGGAVPHISEAEVGRYMKAICREIGGSFDAFVEVTKSKGSYNIVEKKHRWELVSTHTARRTGATLLYTQYNVPLHSCMMLTGHKTPANFLKYIKVSKEQNARMLADNPFFN